MSIRQFLILPFALLLTLSLQAQDNDNARQALRKVNRSQKSFSKTVNRSSLDVTAKALLTHFANDEMDSLQAVIRADNQLDARQKVLALNAQKYLLGNMEDAMNAPGFDPIIIRDTRNSFLELWQLFRTQKPTGEVMKKLDPNRAAFMAAVFKDYSKAGSLQDMATLKKYEQSPEKIMDFLSTNPGYTLRDSLLFISANLQPEKFIAFVNMTKDEQLLQAIRTHSSPLVQTLLRIAPEKNVTNYLPFAEQIAAQRISLEEVDKARAVPSQYFKLMVDAQMAGQAAALRGENPAYRKALRDYVNKYAIQFFTDVINSLHNEGSEKARYFVLEDMRPQDLYYIIIGGETELYTSSYLYTYKKLMGNFEKIPSDSLFRLVSYDRYRKFISLAARYNTLSPFMKQMAPETGTAIIKRFMTGLERQDAGLEETINVAETFPGLIKDNTLAMQVSAELKSNYDRCKAIPSREGQKVYSLLTQVFQAVKSNQVNNNAAGLPPALQVYYTVPHKQLRNSDGSSITEVVLFYGDDDGKAAYNSYMSAFSDASQWTIEKNESWVTIRSKKLFPITIYANLPLSNDAGLDDKAQQAMMAYLGQQGIKPHILIHRGHSYHLPSSIKWVTPDTRLIFLGSCGGYKEIFDVLERSNTAQAISTKQIGSAAVNDPILRIINERLLNQKDLDWSTMWQELDKQLKSNKLAYDYFQEYVPPYKNIALLVAKLYGPPVKKEGDYVSR